MASDVPIAAGLAETLHSRPTTPIAIALSVPPVRVSQEVRDEIENALRNAKANISTTIKEWPAKVGKSEVHGLAGFKSFKYLRQFRNNLMHPKLEPLQPNELTQDQLLQQASAAKAAWAVAEVKKMARVLYTAFGAKIPPEVK